MVLAWAKDVGADLARTNVNGGAIAIGHPLGASGARIMTTMVNALEQRGVAAQNLARALIFVEGHVQVLSSSAGRQGSEALTTPPRP